MTNSIKEVMESVLSCLWSRCKYICENLLDLSKHIETHLELNESQTENSDYNCSWTGCNYSTVHLDRLRKHVFYHGYYNFLLLRGKYECEKRLDIPKCHVSEKVFDLIPEVITNYLCEWTDCERSFESIIEYQDHVIKHVIFECDIVKTGNGAALNMHCGWRYCYKQFEHKYRLIEHVKIHSNQKEAACCQCGKTFCTKTSLFEHLVRQDNNNQKFQCCKCFKCFPTKKLLNSHIKKHLNLYKCTMCYVTCSSKSSLATHIRYRHISDKPFQCTKCSHKCVRKSDLTKHLHHAHTKKLHQCNEVGCTYAVRTYNLLRRHYLEIHEDSPIIYLCHICEKPYRNGKTLTQHLKVKHQLQRPEGHKRFIYRADENGFYRLKFNEK
ncbi:histone H4 transcription factor [Teleopsis dalmanni]|uniref:histone H4 transcription factor n=1 Tax=Teleopsis dalmanni TaxID=139649 RepID=UPI0018CF0343|nr:histone H4 transcription factor [Teleopsis dalmanni]